jgi:hypothetical protein
MEYSHEQKIDFNERLQALIDSQLSGLIVQLHTENQLSAGDIVLQLISNDIVADTFPPEYLDFLKNQTEQFMTKSGHNPWMKAVADLLKSKGCYQKTTKTRIERQKQSMLEAHGVINPGQLKSQRDKLTARNTAEVFKLPLSTGYKEYYKKVELLTNRIKNKWKKNYKHSPKIDYYTKLPFLKEMCDPHLMQGDLYPTIDHKLSVYYCFSHNIPAEICAAEENLCWTFRWLNSRKNELPEEVFTQHVLQMYKDPLQEEIKALINQGYTACE